MVEIHATEINPAVKQESSSACHTCEDIKKEEMLSINKVYISRNTVLSDPSYYPLLPYSNIVTK